MNEKLEAFLGRLEDAKKIGGQYKARCPAHQDQHPSLTVREGHTWILLFCHTGCSAKQILDAVGATWKDILLDEDAPWQPTRRMLQSREVELECIFAADELQSNQAALDWLEQKRGWSPEALSKLRVGYEEKHLTLPVYNKEGKLHDVLHYFPSGATHPKLKAGYGKSRTLWPSPESVRVPEGEAGALYVVEGEGTAISMWSCGLSAVALPGGISKRNTSSHPSTFTGAGWHKSWYARFRRFPKLVLVPDCDETGRRLMTVASYDLNRDRQYNYVVDIAPHRSDGYDVGDFLASATSDQLRQQARQAMIDITREFRSVRSAA